jgi:hypothetical protein
LFSNRGKLDSEDEEDNEIRSMNSTEKDILEKFEKND